MIENKTLDSRLNHSGMTVMVGMDFKGYLAKGIDLIKLSRPAADALAQDPYAFNAGVLFVAIGGLAGGIGTAIFSFGIGFSAIIFWPVVAVLMSFVHVFILFVIAKILGGTGSYRRYYGALGVGSMPIWAAIIPFFGSILSLWTIPIAVIVTERVHKISTARAILAVIIPMLFIFLVLALLIAVIGMAGLMNLFQFMHSNRRIMV
ncbi:MAG: YIP1 family protein [Nitrospirota bacterium]